MDTRLNPFSIDFLSIPSPTQAPNTMPPFISTMNQTNLPQMSYESFKSSGKLNSNQDHSDKVDKSLYESQTPNNMYMTSSQTRCIEAENFNPLTGKYDVFVNTHISANIRKQTAFDEHSDEVNSTSGESDIATSDLTTSTCATGSGGEEVDSPAQKHKFAPLADVISDAHGRKYKKPSAPYIAIISTAILQSPERKLLLSDIYDFFMDTYPYFKHQKNNVWKNSIRHNLSLNECFMKNGRSNLGKGNYWSIHPACEEDFLKGNFSRRRARRRAKRGAFSQVQLPAPNSAIYPPYSSTASASSAYMPMTTVDTNVGVSYRQYPLLSSAATTFPPPLPKTNTSGHKPLYSEYTTPTYGQNQTRAETNVPFGSITHARTSQTHGASRDEKSVPPNINAAHMAQLGLTGAYNSALRNPYIEHMHVTSAPMYGHGYSGLGENYTNSSRGADFGNLYTSLMF